MILEDLHRVGEVWGFPGRQTGHSWSSQAVLCGFGYMWGISVGPDGRERVRVGWDVMNIGGISDNVDLGLRHCWPDHSSERKPLPSGSGEFYELAGKSW